MNYNFQSSQEEVLHFLYLRIKKLTEQNEVLKKTVEIYKYNDKKR